MSLVFEENSRQADPRGEAPSFPETVLEHRPRILSLDGGGTKGLVSLLIMRHIMNDITVRLELKSTALPCDYFDLICGVGLGGLIAIMLGRLGMVLISPSLGVLKPGCG
jgi:hypothetical protein